MSKKITDQEHEELKDLRKSSLEVASILGDLGYQKVVLDLMMEEQKAKVLEIKRRETEFLEKIKTNYGAVSINVDTGEIS